MNLDPKTAVLKARLKNIKRIIAVSGFKGGIGKSSIACTLAMLLSAKGKKTGLMDLDFNGASCDIILGLKKEFPEEIEGLTPPEIGGVKFMTPAFFSQNRAVNLRGAEVTNAILELLAVTRWQELDFLILDMPPGFADAALDIIRFIPQAEVLIVTTPSILSKTLAEKAEETLIEMGVKIAGRIENMSEKGIREDSTLEAAYGNPEEILATDFAADLRKEVQKILVIKAWN